VVSLRLGYARPARHHGIGTACVSTGRESTYRNRNAVARNRATSVSGLIAVEIGRDPHLVQTILQEQMNALLRDVANQLDPPA